jgi:soluble lytic murein transglycosylase
VRFRWRTFFLGAVLIPAAIFAVWQWSEWRLDHSQDVPIRAAARRYGLEPALVKAVVWQESRFHPEARGRAGEIGLMQLMENTAQEWADSEKIANFSHEHCFDPATNTLAGTYYLNKVLKRYRTTDNPLPYALADFNAGRANVLRWNQGEAATNSAAFMEAITFPGTRKYVISVMRRFDYYRPIFLKE